MPKLLLVPRHSMAMLSMVVIQRRDIGFHNCSVTQSGIIKKQSSLLEALSLYYVFEHRNFMCRPTAVIDNCHARPIVWHGPSPKSGLRGPMLKSGHARRIPWEWKCILCAKIRMNSNRAPYRCGIRCLILRHIRYLDPLRPWP